jgi:hypothetical protein
MSDLEAEYGFLGDDVDDVNYEECVAVLEFENKGHGQIRGHIATLEYDEIDDAQNEGEYHHASNSLNSLIGCFQIFPSTLEKRSELAEITSGMFSAYLSLPEVAERIQ